MSKILQIAVMVLLYCSAVSGAQAAEPAGGAVPDDTATRDSSWLSSTQPDIWQNDVGQGFRSTVHTFGVEAGAMAGITAFGSRQAHDLALMDLSYGHMLTATLGEGHWYRGNVEGRLELFGGAEFRPDQEWLIGFAPHLRYNFATGTRLIPFFDLGAGVTATGIGPPDLSNTFEFNLQATVGAHYFFRTGLALTLEARYMHLSCAGISHPNLGLNGVVGMVGLTKFF